MKKLLCILFASIMALSLVACDGKDTSDGKDRLARIKEKGYIEFVTEPYWAPNEFIDPSKTGDEQYVGLDIELAKYIAEKIGVDLKIIPLEFTAVQTSITEGKHDMAISALAWTPTREEAMYLSKGYTVDKTTGYGFLVKAGDEEKFTCIDDLKEAIVITQSGSLQEGIYNEYCKNAKELQLVSSMSDAYLAVKEGKADVCITGLAAAELFSEANEGMAIPNFKFDLDDKYNSTCVGIPLPKEDSESFMEIINQCITELTEQGKLDEWNLQYIEYAKGLGIDVN